MSGLRLRILDRYMIAELGGPFFFGLSAFTLIIASVDLLNVSRLAAAYHAPLGATIAYFLWQLPGIMVTVVPMAMLLGVLLAIQRLSGESEITALKAGGVSLLRTAAPILAMGVVVSIIALLLQEGVVPYANDRANYLRREVIQHANPLIGANLTFSTHSPTGGRQLTSATGFDSSTNTMLNVTLIQYDTDDRPTLLISSKRARFHDPDWTFFDATEYHFGAGQDVSIESVPVQEVHIEQKPAQIAQRAADNNPENLSRREVREILRAGTLTPSEMRAFEVAYEEKISRPFATFVFALIALPFGLRPTRGGGTGLGFGMAVVIVFIYFVTASVSSAIATGIPGGRLVPLIGAWLPNVIFTAIGIGFLRRVVT
ncbi:MAG TPA: LptF/LptG family permease [Candidatus Baltobacteraceae bacterium]|jgi:lipopolysaccharide export system permease protein|nr:LptF/LptG family permease [Candidatus Baltobacteraceae bacterium]